MSKPELNPHSTPPPGDDRRFQGKVAIVTGAAGGIGAAAARAFLAAGADVVAIDVKPPDPGLSAAGVSFVTGDVADPAVYERAIAVGGRVDVLFANAGIGIDTGILELELDEWKRVLEVNLTGALVGARAAFGAMVSQGDGGAIVFTSSPHALRTEAGNASYAASKAGLLGMTRALAVEGAAEGVRVNAVLPGAIDTPMVRSFVESQPDREAALEAFAAVAPLNRLGEPEEIADAVLFLASDQASFVTGASLAVDGGLLARM